MKVVVNGVQHELPRDSRVRDGVVAAGAEPDARGLAVAVDGAVVPRSAWDSERLSDGQRVEVLHAVQGG